MATPTYHSCNDVSVTPCIPRRFVGEENSGNSIWVVIDAIWGDGAVIERQVGSVTSPQIGSIVLRQITAFWQGRQAPFPLRKVEIPYLSSFPRPSSPFSIPPTNRYHFSTPILNFLFWLAPPSPILTALERCERINIRVWDRSLADIKFCATHCEPWLVYIAAPKLSKILTKPAIRQPMKMLSQSPIGRRVQCTTSAWLILIRPLATRRRSRVYHIELLW